MMKSPAVFNVVPRCTRVEITTHVGIIPRWYFCQRSHGTQLHEPQSEQLRQQLSIGHRQRVKTSIRHPLSRLIRTLLLLLLWWWLLNPLLLLLTRLRCWNCYNSNLAILISVYTSSMLHRIGFTLSPARCPTNGFLEDKEPTS